MKKRYIIVGILVVLLTGFWVTINHYKTKENIINNMPAPTADTKVAQNNMTTATLHTNKGDITIEFFPKDAPNTVANFLKLAQQGFYDGVRFHRVIKGFMIQGGDPFSKDDTKVSSWGTGGPGYAFADEIDPTSDLYAKGGYAKGIVAMANSGPNTNGSQFFIMTADYPLPPAYTIFGKVDSGQDVVDAIANVQTIKPANRPVSPITIKSISVK